MGYKKVNQSFNVAVTFNIPNVVTQELETGYCDLANSYLGWIPVIGPTIGAVCKVQKQIKVSDVLNAVPNASVVWNDILAAGLNVQQFVTKGFDVSAVQVIKSNWTVDKNGHAVLNAQVNTTSDPLTASAVTEMIIGTALLITAAAIPIFLAVPGVGWLILLALAGAGLALIGAAVVEIVGSSVGNLVATGLLIGGLVVVAVLVIPAISGFAKGKGKSQKQRR